MGKLLFKVVVMLAITIGVSNYAMYLMTGKMPMSDFFSKASVSGPDMPEVSNLLPKGSERAYKWTDENGVVHYSSEAPEHVNAETMNVNPDTNLIQGIQKTAKEEKIEQAPPTQPLMPQGNIYNPGTIRKLMDDAKGVQSKLNERYEELENHSR